MLMQEIWEHDYFNIPFSDAERINETKKVISGAYYIIKSSFSDVEGAFVASNVKVSLLAENSIFDQCFRSDHGAAISLMSVTGYTESIIRRCCMTNCSIRGNTMAGIGNAFFVEVSDTNYSRNEFLDSTIACINPLLGEAPNTKFETQYNKYGRIIIKNINDTNNKSDRHCGILCLPSLIAIAKYCTIAHNEAAEGCFIYTNYGQLSASHINVISNKMTSIERAIVYANADITLSLAYFAKNVYVKNLFYGKNGLINAYNVYILEEKFNHSGCLIETTELLPQTFSHIKLGSCHADVVLNQYISRRNISRGQWRIIFSFLFFKLFLNCSSYQDQYLLLQRIII